MGKPSKIQYDPKQAHRAMNLLGKLFYRFPMKFQENEDLALNHDARMQFWRLLLKAIENEGFTHLFPMEITKRNNSSVFSAAISPRLRPSDVVNSILNGIHPTLKQIPVLLQNDTVILGTEFEALAYIFEFLFDSLQECERNNNYSRFQIFIEVEYISLEEFKTNVNKILDMFFGEKIVGLLDDGKFWFTDDTLEKIEENIALSSLINNKMIKVVEDFDEIRKFMFGKKYNKALEQCRTTAEDFLKDLLLNHNIKSCSNDRKGNPIKTQDDTLSNLCITMKKQVSSLFSFPPYFKQRIILGIEHFTLSIDHIIGGITNEFSHGKGKHTNQASEKDAKITIGFLVNMINLLLAYQK